LIRYQFAMPDIKGDKLFVNLGASQARRRLKGFGHGVRKIQTAGKDKSVIIHTAADRNLEELQQRQFADVGYSNFEHLPADVRDEQDDKSEAWLHAERAKAVE
jgi:hypothetical protein